MTTSRRKYSLVAPASQARQVISPFLDKRLSAPKGIVMRGSAQNKRNLLKRLAVPKVRFMAFTAWHLKRVGDATTLANS